MESAQPKAKTTRDWLKVNPKLPDGPPKEASHMCEELAEYFQQNLPEGAEKATAMRKLLEAKDCAVRATLQFS